MDRGSELSKTVATFIIQRIILDNNGLNYVCNTAERFQAVNSVLSNMLANNPSMRLLKHIIRCYSRIVENHRAKSVLRENIPPIFMEKSFIDGLDEGSKKWLQVFLKSLGMTSSSQQKQVQDTPFNLMMQGNLQNNSTYVNFQNTFDYDYQNYADK